jgi:hypothetical protein
VGNTETDIAEAVQKAEGRIAAGLGLRFDRVGRACIG